MSDRESNYGLSELIDQATTQAPDYALLPKMPDSYRPKIALIGAGGISEYHLKAYRELGLDVVFICDSDVKRAEQRRDEFYPAAKVGTSPDPIWSDEAIEVVDIATHPEPRVPLVRDALRHGKHVLSQKPFAVDLSVGEELVAMADDCNRKLAVNQNGRWAPHFRYLLEASRAGLFGPIASVDFSLQWDHSWTADTPFNEIHHLILYDFAIHWFDMASALLEDRVPERVSASIRSASFQRPEPPMLAHVTIDYPDAQVTMGLNGHVKWGQEDRTIVAGRDGTGRAFGPSLNEQTVVIWSESGVGQPILFGDWFSNGFQGTMAELLCSIAEDREPENSARRNLKSLELCFAAVASANAGRQINVGEARRLT